MTLRRSTPEQIAAWRRRSKPINPVSAKGNGKRNAWRITARRVKDRDGWRCRARIDYGLEHECSNDLHVHHLRRRSQGGEDEAGNLVTVCATAHRYVHDHPEQAKALGLLR